MKAPGPVPEEGHRYLEAGETMKAGDRVYCRSDWKWHELGSAWEGLEPPAAWWPVLRKVEARRMGYKFVPRANKEAAEKFHRLLLNMHPKTPRISRKKKKWTYKAHGGSVFKRRDIRDTSKRSRLVYRYFYYMAWGNNDE